MKMRLILSYRKYKTKGLNIPVIKKGVNDMSKNEIKHGLLNEGIENRGKYRDGVSNPQPKSPPPRPDFVPKPRPPQTDNNSK